MAVLTGSKARAEQQLGRPLQIVLCYEVGYDGFWLARYLIARAIHTIVFDPASFLMPRRSRVAKTDRRGLPTSPQAQQQQQSIE
jgi:transposase